MKLSNLTAKLTCGNIKLLSTLGGLALAGAAFTVGAPAAEAQHFGFGVQFGGPRYVERVPAPVYRDYRPGFYGPAFGSGYIEPREWDRRRADEWRAHEYWEHRRFEGRPVPYRGF